MRLVSGVVAEPAKSSPTQPNQPLSTQPMSRSYQNNATKEVERPLQLSCSLPSNHAMMEVDCFIHIQTGLASGVETETV